MRDSKWTYNTGSTAGASVEFVIASGGEIALNDPDGHRVNFHYGGAGVGYGVGIKISKIRIPKIRLPDIKIPPVFGHEVGGAGSIESFDSGGYVFMAPGFHGAELSRSDFQGATIYFDAGAGLGYAKAATGMLMGINAARLAMGMSSPMLEWMAIDAIADARACLLMYGTSVGLVAGGGIGILVGYVH
ncbi:hypothetical protein [Paraburkholderia sp. J67]|uniref:hypothetical protein n=1 Tax=Paraburkholderia sp. J67 TaxID=2805435 RepID=UPI002ABDEDCE|nr:hypothetical protein [Paraburkholderia sp. J67]